MKLADGSVKNLITGYCVADIELVTRAGTVVLPRSTIDIIEGPESENLIYIGEAEEERLKLRSYAQQLEDLARKGVGKGKPRVPVNEKKHGKSDKHSYKQAKFKGSQRQSGEPPTRSVRASLGDKPVLADGEACVGEHNWTVFKRTPYLLEPLTQECYVTTAALQGSDVKAGKTLPNNGVAILDLDRNVRAWMGFATGILNGKYVSEVELSLRLFPDVNKDTVGRLTKVPKVLCRVVESEVPALVIGRRVCGHLLERNE